MKSPYDLYFQLMLISTNTESSNSITSNNWKTGVNVLALVNRFFFKIFVGHMSICGATDTPVLDFW